jgi:hypothetical protein
MQLSAVLTNAIKALDFRTLGLTNNSGSLTLDLTNPSGSGMTIRSTTTSGAQTLFKITSNVGGTGNTVLRVNASGAVFSDSTFNSQGADYAEWFKVRGQEGGEAGQYSKWLEIYFDNPKGVQQFRVKIKAKEAIFVNFISYISIEHNVTNHQNREFCIRAYK